MSSPSVLALVASALAGGSLVSLISPSQRSQVRSPGIPYSTDENVTLLETMWVRLATERSDKENIQHKAVHILYEMESGRRGTYVQPVMSTAGLDLIQDMQRLDTVQESLDEGVTFVVLSPDGQGPAWAKCDKNRDGKVSPDEMNRVLDSDKNGLVTIQEILDQWPDVHIKLPLVRDRPTWHLWDRAKESGFMVAPLLVVDIAVMMLVCIWYVFWPAVLPAGSLTINSLKATGCKGGAKLLVRASCAGCEHETGIVELAETGSSAEWSPESIMKFKLDRASSGTKLHIEVFDHSTGSPCSAGKASVKVRTFVASAPQPATESCTLRRDKRIIFSKTGTEIKITGTFAASS